jgi:hypothetical protein
MSNSLVTKVGDLLSNQNAKLGGIFKSNFKSTAETSEGEQRELNRYFRVQLSTLRISTLDECECLRDDIAPVYWLKYFETHVLPTLVRFNLPQE